MDVGSSLRDQRMSLPALTNRAHTARLLGISSEHLLHIEQGIAWPSGELMEKLIELLEMPPFEAVRLWEALAVHQLDPVTGSWVRVAARRKKK